MSEAVGLGVFDPSTGEAVTKLEGDGDAKIGDSSGDLIQITGSVEQLGTSLQISGDDARVKINGDTNSHPGLEFYENGTRKWIIFNNYGDDSLDFKTNSNTRMVINQDGTVGIGTISPSTTLDVDGTVNATTYQIGGTAISSTAAELNLLDASVTSEASDGAWAVVERIAKVTVDSNDYARSAGPVSLGVTIPDNAILTKYVFDCTQTFAAGDDGSEVMAVVDLGLYNASGKIFDFASQANIERTGASSAPYVAGTTQVFPMATITSAKLTEALTAKIHVFDDGSGMLNSLDAGALDIYIYYIIGA